MMQTIQLQLDDSLYKRLVKNNIDIQEEAYRHLEECIEDDGYPAISFEEAKTRVTEQIEAYRSGKMKTVALDKTFWDDIENGLMQRHQKTI